MAKKTIKCPSWMDSEAKKLWEMVIKEVGENLNAVDLTSLECYAVAYSKWRNAEKYLAENGTTMTTKTGYRQQQPEVAISKQAMSDMRAYEKELGLTPAARSRISKNSNELEDGLDEDLKDMISK